MKKNFIILFESIFTAIGYDATKYSVNVEINKKIMLNMLEKQAIELENQLFFSLGKNMAKLSFVKTDGSFTHPKCEIDLNLFVRRFERSYFTIITKLKICEDCKIMWIKYLDFIERMFSIHEFIDLLSDADQIFLNEPIPKNLLLMLFKFISEDNFTVCLEILKNMGMNRKNLNNFLNLIGKKFINKLNHTSYLNPSDFIDNSSDALLSLSKRKFLWCVILKIDLIFYAINAKTAENIIFSISISISKLKAQVFEWQKGMPTLEIFKVLTKYLLLQNQIKLLPLEYACIYTNLLFSGNLLESASAFLQKLLISSTEKYNFNEYEKMNKILMELVQNENSSLVYFSNHSIELSKMPGLLNDLNLMIEKKAGLLKIYDLFYFLLKEKNCVIFNFNFDEEIIKLYGFYLAIKKNELIAKNLPEDLAMKQIITLALDEDKDFCFLFPSLFLEAAISFNVDFFNILKFILIFNLNQTDPSVIELIFHNICIKALSLNLIESEDFINNFIDLEFLVVNQSFFNWSFSNYFLDHLIPKYNFLALFLFLDYRKTQSSISSQNMFHGRIIPHILKEKKNHNYSELFQIILDHFSKDDLKRELYLLKLIDSKEKDCFNSLLTDLKQIIEPSKSFKTKFLEFFNGPENNNPNTIFELLHADHIKRNSTENVKKIVNIFLNIETTDISNKAMILLDVLEILSRFIESFTTEQVFSMIDRVFSSLTTLTEQSKTVICRKLILIVLNHNESKALLNKIQQFLFNKMEISLRIDTNNLRFIYCEMIWFFRPRLDQLK